MASWRIPCYKWNSRPEEGGGGQREEKRGANASLLQSAGTSVSEQAGEEGDRRGTQLGKSTKTDVQGTGGRCGLEGQTNPVQPSWQLPAEWTFRAWF